MTDIIIEDYVNKALRIANDDTHGYSQVDRWSPDFDCSSLVIYCLDIAGIPVKKFGATYTGNLANALLSCGFHKVDYKDVKRGDILLNHNSKSQHCAIAINSTQIVHARHGNGITGDQDGTEICVTPIYQFDNVFRYEPQTHDEPSCVINSIELPELSRGSEGRYVKLLQSLLTINGFANVGSIDGLFGVNTETAVKQFQERNKEVCKWVDGIVGVLTWTTLFERLNT